MKALAPRPALVLAATAAALLPFVLAIAFTGIEFFDDEGTLLAPFHILQNGHRLYDDVFTLYGPFYNALYGLLYGPLGLPVSHTAGRLLFVVLYLAWNAAFAWLCLRLTGSRLLMVATMALGVLWLRDLAHSPGHPEELCLLLLAVLLILVARFEAQGRTADLALIGATIAALALVKVNLGAFAFLAVGLALATRLRPGRLETLGIGALAALLLALPIVLPWPMFGTGWARTLSLFALLSIAAALAATLRPPAGTLTFGHAAIAAAGGLAVLAATLAAVLAAGSTPMGVLNGTILQNLDFIRRWNIPADLGAKALLAAALALALALLHRAAPSRPRWAETLDLTVLALKIGFVAMAAFALHRPDLGLRALVPFCWLIAIPGPASTLPMTRAAIALLGATMALYIFPVAGHQTVIAAALPVVMVPLLVHDIAAALDRRGATAARIAALAPRLAAAALLLFAATATMRAATTHAAQEPLGLPGTTLIRVPPAQAAELRWAVARLADCNAVYSLPGMPSFTLWHPGPLPTPLLWNGLPTFMTEAQQHRIVADLAAHPGLCILHDARLADFFRRQGEDPNAPLLAYVAREFAPVAAQGRYTILRR